MKLHIYEGNIIAEIDMVCAATNICGKIWHIDKTAFVGNTNPKDGFKDKVRRPDVPVRPNI